ncbi:pyridoxal phosphate-dependent decarboxylase family protein [Phytomonospora endophytica]|uniref:Glutamate/tyrosine decarboxylase-like PLP-dependent enzyme n=1 Tax=Phytomonospora endophytica TaxID=714109 RepID=A0A841FV20_9ACTN|nr:aminotransferase class V-fold PLP-dependent enzyme [Phytomonospora endophytica]MBB6038613.1 glutamate/tyrosine decarboxylase-like PLP-dependent enzyme [Phytomonospora endophytica]GIG69243.1 aspartate aminotransferase family protein [Phytomonospora endophytica]
MDLREWLPQAVEAHSAWRAGFGVYTPHPVDDVDDEDFAAAYAEFVKRMDDNYPFFHPRYAGQMVKPPHPAAVIGYVTAMLANPNNHAREGGPATTDMEIEVVAELAGMFGFPRHLGHLTGGGTVANLEALYVARESHPGRDVAFSADGHTAHARMCHLLGMRGHAVPVDAHGRMDMDALEDLLRGGRVGTVVLTAGTTGLGAVDPIHEALVLKEKYGVRLHVDAAYGGFFTLLAGGSGAEALPSEPWLAIGACDSVVVDPHKHGLQPYGCGAVIFSDPGVARHYRHESPFTFFTEAALHLGEVSLECSRAGAAAAALWLTLKVLPLTRDGLGAVLACGRRAALRWAELITDSPALDLYQRPELDIVTFFPRTEPMSLSGVDAGSTRLCTTAAEAAADPVFLSILCTTAEAFRARHPGAVGDAEQARVLRSVLLKPESETHLDGLHHRVEELAMRRDR